MHEHLLDPEVQRFIITHENDDENELILKGKKIKDVPAAVVADQIVGRRKAKAKLPLYYSSPGIVYPPTVNLEQCTSEEVAQLKSDLINREVREGLRCIDLTGGFGVDTFFLSKIFHAVESVEPNSSLLEIARHNHKQLNAENISYYNTHAEEFLDEINTRANLIYVDPSRRDNASKKVIKFSDCSPNVVELLNIILLKTDFALIKASPMLDVQQGITELKNVHKVYVIAVENDCKELLFLCIKEKGESSTIETINVRKGVRESFSFSLSEEKLCGISFSDPRQFLYEPNSAILKAGAFKMAANRYLLDKISPNTHLYTSDKLIDGFPGRTFRILSFVKPNSVQLKKILPEMRANVLTRNYPLSVNELKKKLAIADGGNNYIIGFSGQSKKYLVVASRIR